jgi:catechol 2,3-dioxygenase-like lactoylglutathione lyase family enzyme
MADPLNVEITGFRIAAPEPARLADFYRTAFGFEPEGEALCLGPSRIELSHAGLFAPKRVASNDPRFQHFALVVRNMSAAISALASTSGWTPISTSGPERLPLSSGGVVAFKFRDPDGHPLEFLEFPHDAGPEVWRRSSGLFLGIDHTAIAVTNVGASIAFYETLGFRVANSGTNRGVEQSRLDGFGDATETAVDVIALNPSLSPTPPHIEFLSYLEPPMIQRDDAGSKSAPSTGILLSGLTGARRDVFDPDGHYLCIE